MKILHRLCYMLILVVASANAQIVEIPDPNLRKAITEKLQLPTGAPITQQEMQRLTDHLAASQRQIADLTGLQYATNLRELWMWGNPINDLTPISNLTELRKLDLAGCQVSDLTPLGNLIQLQLLNIGWNKVTDISILANLINLERLRLYGNHIFDYRPLSKLTRTVIERDPPCALPALSIQERMQNRTFPSVFSAWGSIYNEYNPVLNRREISSIEKLSLHDLYWSGLIFNQRFAETQEESEVTGIDLENSMALRNELLAFNPNMLFLAEVRLRDASIGPDYPEDFPYWLRDIHGNRIETSPESQVFLFDFTQPGMQDVVVQQAIAVAKCGLYDGIFFDWMAEDSAVLTGHSINHPYPYPIYSLEEEQVVKDSIIERIRASVRDDFLIIINTNRHKIPRKAWAINGTFMETLRDNDHGYTHKGLKQIENTLLWAEDNLRDPQINCLEGWGLPTESPDSPNNRRWMRVFTTMSLTHSDGYVLYIDRRSNRWIGGGGHEHFWYSFWDADLGRPTGTKAEQYHNTEGLFIREFTNGWAVYNRSGNTQAITLTRSSIGVSSNKEDITHLLPDLDGEIYLRKGKPYDLNNDGTVNILDLILVSQYFGTAHGDINGDGITDILDLTLIAQRFSQ